MRNDAKTAIHPFLVQPHRTLLLPDDLGGAPVVAQHHQGEVEIGKTLDFMSEYTDHHFSAEEKHMAEVGYPGLEVAVHPDQDGWSPVHSRLPLVAVHCLPGAARLQAAQAGIDG